MTETVLTQEKSTGADALARNKKLVQGAVKYFVDTTGCSFDQMITKIIAFSQYPDTSVEGYTDWLLLEILKCFETYGITPELCVSRKDVLRASVEDDDAKQEGEFYTPEEFCKMGRDYIERFLPGVMAQSNVWDIACGTGNLMRTANHAPDRLFLSSLLEQDIEAVKSAYPEGVTAFQLDACNGIDWDENNMLFSNQLPENLVAKLKADEPILFYMNPPYSQNGIVNDMYAVLRGEGMTTAATDIYYHFLYRICKLIDTYHLTKCYVAVFGPTNWLQTDYRKNFRDRYYDYFKYVGGFAFPCGEFIKIKTSSAWYVSLTIWKQRSYGDTEIPPVLLDYYTRNSSGVLQQITQVVAKPSEVKLSTWCKGDIIDMNDYFPAISSPFNFKGYKLQAPSKTLMFMMSGDNVMDATRRAALTNFPNELSMPVCEENFWRCVVSFGIRCSLVPESYMGKVALPAPDTSVAGYDVFEANCLALCLGSLGAYCYSYRDIDPCNEGDKISRNNAFFCLDNDECKGLITDPVLIEDMAKHPVDNTIMMNAIREKYPIMTEATKNLVNFVREKTATSLSGSYRAEAKYQNWTNAYDAGLVQIRSVKELWSDADDERLRMFVSPVIAEVRSQLGKFGIVTLIDTKED